MATPPVAFQSQKMICFGRAGREEKLARSLRPGLAIRVRHDFPTVQDQRTHPHTLMEKDQLRTGPEASLEDLVVHLGFLRTPRKGLKPLSRDLRDRDHTGSIPDSGAGIEERTQGSGGARGSLSACRIRGKEGGICAWAFQAQLEASPGHVVASRPDDYNANHKEPAGYSSDHHFLSIPPRARLREVVGAP
jgi:hypothetical protein